MLTTIHLLRTNPTFTLPNGGIILNFGAFDITALPSVGHFTKFLLLNVVIIQKFIEAFLPDKTLEELKHPSISPYYENLDKFQRRLPHALFTIGTEDALMDDTLCMATKWLVKGGEAILRVYQGAPHGFIAFPRQALKEAGDAQDDIKTYIQDRLGSI